MVNTYLQDKSFTRRLERAFALETAFHRAFLDLGWWAHRITDSEKAPLLAIPRSKDHVRAPDIILFSEHKYCLIEIKESLVENLRVSLYRDQITAYMHYIDHPFLLVICASSGDYAGCVGSITLDRLAEYLKSSDSEVLHIPLIELDSIGEYAQDNVYLTPDKMRHVLRKTSVKTKKGSV